MRMRMNLSWRKLRVPVIASAAVLAIVVACAPMSTPELASLPGGTTSVTARIVQIETADEPYMRLFAYITDQASTPHTSFKIGNFVVSEYERPVPVISQGIVDDPYYAVLIIDRSGSMGSSGEAASEAASIDFVNALPEGSNIALIEFDDEVTVTLTFTTDKTAVINAINAGTIDGMTAIYDAIAAGAELLRDVEGRKLLVALTDGEDNSSANTLDSVITIVNSAGLSANTVTLDTGTTIDTTPMQNIASQTGGTYFATTTGLDLSAAFLAAIDVFENLVYVKYRQRKEGDVKLYLNYGSLTATATKSFPEEPTASPTPSALLVDSP